MLYFIVSVVVLAILLFVPVSKLVWTLSVRRMERRLRRVLSPDELRAQLTRARVIAALICTAFSFLFNLNLIGVPAHG